MSAVWREDSFFYSLPLAFCYFFKLGQIHFFYPIFSLFGFIGLDSEHLFQTDYYN